jgi:hypothetical protein
VTPTIAQRDHTIEGLREAAEAKDRQIAELRRWRSGGLRTVGGNTVVSYVTMATVSATAAHYMSDVAAGITGAVAGAIAATMGLAKARRKKDESGH